MNGRQELLAVLPGAATDEALEHLRSIARVTQVASRRVIVVECERTELSRAVPGVVLVAPGAEPPSDVTERLDDVEALFVAAWASRAADRPKDRSGEGLPWDFPGFEPPDPPPGVQGGAAGRT